MKEQNESRLKKSVKNISAEVSIRILQILLPFFIRTTVIKKFGIEYMGISGLFTSIIGMLGIADLGMYGTIKYSLYEPVVEGDEARIRAVLNFYRKAYFIIGLVILINGIALTPFLKVLVKEGTYPDELNIYILYYEYLINSVCTYVIFSYKSALLEAHQNGYKVSIIRGIMLLLQYCVQLFVLMFLNNYYLYVLILPISTFVTCILIARLADHEYPFCIPKGTIKEKERTKIYTNIKAVFFYKIGSIVLSSGDNLVISWYLGAGVLGIYNAYYYVLSAVFSLLTAINDAIIPSIGNSLVTASREKNANDFIKFSYMYEWIVACCSVCLLCLYQPFIHLWIGKKFFLNYKDVVLFSVFFYVRRSMDIVGCYKDAAGLWRKDQFRPLIGAVVNIFLNIVLIRYFSVTGILLSSILSVITIFYPLSVKVVLEFLGIGKLKYWKMQLVFFGKALIAGISAVFLCAIIPDNNNAVFRFIINGIISMIIPVSVIFILSNKNEEFITGMQFIRNIMYNPIRKKQD